MRIDEIKQEALNILDDRGFRRVESKSGVIYALESDPTLRARVMDSGILLTSSVMHLVYNFQQYNVMRAEGGYKRFNSYIKASIRKHTKNKEAQEAYMGHELTYRG